MVFAASVDPEPTPDFDTYCLSVVRRWEAHELSFKDAIESLSTKEQEAIAASHIANQARANHLLGALQHYRGNLNTSIAHYEKARLLYQRVGNVKNIAKMDLNNGENYRLKGDYTRARRMYRAAYETAQEIADIYIQTMALVNEGLALEAAGQLSAARKVLIEGYELSKQWAGGRDRLPALLCELHNALTSIYLKEEKLQLAWQEATLTLENAHLSGEVKYMGFAYRALGEAVTVIDMPDAADPDEYFRQAIDVFKEMNMEAEMARTIFAQARSLAHRGRKTMAVRKLQQVMAMFSQLGMADDAAKAAQAQIAAV